MERKRGNITVMKPTNGETVKPLSKEQFQTFSELTRRILLASQLGVDTYDGNRDIYQALGYPSQATLTYQNYWGRYLRHDIAKAIIDRPVKASWKGEISIIENIKEVETPFEKAWSEIYDRLKLKSIFIRADRLTGLGHYSAIFLGLDDVTSAEGLKNPVSPQGTKKLLYVKPLSEQSAEISTFEENTKSDRFGLPLIYNVKITSGENQKTVPVHYSRVVHLVEDLMEDEVYGTPRLQAVYNRLIDLEKLIGGDAEMFWRGARPGYTGEVQPDYQMTDTQFNELKEQIDEFENNLRRVLINEGVKYDALAQQIADPINHVDVQMQMISAVTGIPKRILTGSERGELSSAQDKQEWITYVTSRREEQNEPMILRPFIDKCIGIGVLPKPTTPYIIRWDKMFSLTDEEKVNMGKNRALTMKEFAMSSIEEYIPLDLFLKDFLNFDEVQVEEIINNRKRAIKEEEELTKDEEEIIGGFPGNGTSGTTGNQDKRQNPNPVSGVHRIKQVEK